MSVLPSMRTAKAGLIAQGSFHSPRTKKTSTSNPAAELLFLNWEGVAAIFYLLPLLRPPLYFIPAFWRMCLLILLRESLQRWQQEKWKLLLSQELCQPAHATRGDLAKALIQSTNVQGVNS